MLNKGAERLARIVAKYGGQKAFGEAMGMDQGYVSRIVRGERSPGVAVRRKLEQECGIRMQDWDKPAKALAS